MDTRPLTFSVNPDIIDKNINCNKDLGSGFATVTDSIENLSEAINDGFAFSYAFKDNHRKAENFLSSDLLIVDIDHGLKTDEALELPVVRDHCSLFYITPSHTPDNHRFRLVFILPRTITDPNDLRAAARAMTRRIGGDMAATDPARLFYGCQDSQPLIFDKSLSTELLDELIEDGKIQPASESINVSGHTANRSGLRLKADMTMLLAGGRQIALQDIKESTSIYCPFHHDRHPSAFASINQRGNHYIHCSSCQKTWWEEHKILEPYDFNAFDKAVRQLKKTGISMPVNQLTPFQQYYGLNTLDLKNIHISTQEYLNIGNLGDGLTIIKSPKGSGKTSFLSNSLRRFIYRHSTLEELEEESSEDYDSPLYTSQRILLIGHRQALIGELCSRLNLNCYLDDPKNLHEVLDRQVRYGVCLDSLWKVKNQRYDIIVIDEVEQVLSHFLSSTIGEKREGLFQIFAQLLAHAQKIVVLDADISWITFTTLTQYLPKMIRSKDKTRHRPIQIYINDREPDRKSLQLYPSVSLIVQKIKACVLDGDRIFICSNSKAKINSLEEMIKKVAKDTGMDVPYKTITSANSKEQGTQSFIKNIKQDILNYQVVLTSPSLGTGIDITFNGNEEKIDHVFGLFENQINSHFEIDQQLSRVRHPKQVHVWVSPQRFNFETEFDVVAADWRSINFQDRIQSGFPISLISEADDISPFLSMVSLITSHSRASKNNLKDNFLKYKEQQGWTIDLVQQDDLLSKEGRDLFNIGKRIAEETHTENILNATVMNRFEFEHFKDRIDSNQDNISQNEWFRFSKTCLELFYGQPADRDLIKIDNHGKTRHQVLLYERLQRSQSISVLRSTLPNFDDIKNRLIYDGSVAMSLLYFLLAQTPVFVKGAFDVTVIFTSDDLKAFVETSRTLKNPIATQLDITIRKDIADNPVQQLGIFLNLLGLSVKKKDSYTSQGRKIYRYCLDTKPLDEMKERVKFRSNQNNIGWTYMDKTYGFTYTEDQYETFYGSQKTNPSG